MGDDSCAAPQDSPSNNLKTAAQDRDRESFFVDVEHASMDSVFVCES